ncbi:MAG: NUDIX domain-containing protein [Ktedonobacterales bacterium]
MPTQRESQQREKVLAYITHGPRLLVLRQPDLPEAGLQVPGGTVEAGELPAAAVLREAWEETGLAGLALVGLLGERTFDMRPYGHAETHHRWFYHLRCAGAVPATWRHFERTPSDGAPGPISFDFSWVALTGGMPPLIAEMGALLPELIASMELRWP